MTKSINPCLVFEKWKEVAYVMKRIIACVLVLCGLSILMFGCAKESDINVSFCEYPGLKWGMTVDEVRAALNLEEDQISAEYIGEKTSRLVVKDLTLFDNQVEIALFNFLPPERGQYGLVPSELGVFGLANVEVYFTEDTDMARVCDAIIEIYGDDVSSVPAYYLRDGEVVEEIWARPDAAEFGHWWTGNSKIEDVIPAEKMQEVIEYYASVFPEATMNTIEEWLELRNFGLIKLWDHSIEDGYTPAEGYTGKGVKFYGDDICQLLLNYGK